MMMSDVEFAVKEIVASLVGSLNVPDDGPLISFGLDSLGATELAGRLSKKFGVRLPPTLVFNCPTANSISSHIGELLNLNVEKTSVDESWKYKDTSATCRVAIIGIGCRFPRNVNCARDLSEVMYNKLDLTGEASLSRWDTDALLARAGDFTQHDISHVKYGAFLSDEVIETFPNSKFGISSSEALHMDPGQRLLLYVAYEALQDAGYSIRSLCDLDMGVFVGASGIMSPVGVSLDAAGLQEMSIYDATGWCLSIAAGRISYTFGLRGPCTTSDTACSSSLTALHVARSSLQLRECKTALVLGVNILSVSASLPIALAGMLSLDGKCHTLDEAANGYSRGEGCGAVVLERIENDTESYERTYATIGGTAVRQDGKSASLTAPNGFSQELLYQATLQDAGWAAAYVSYIEAHRTGTNLGDPIEVASIASVYGSRSGRTSDNPLYISAIKGNMGHLEAAAGMGSLLAALLVLQNRQAPPNAQLQRMNEKIAVIIDGEPIIVPTTPMSVKSCDNNITRVAISSFGYSGTIVHV